MQFLKIYVTLVILCCSVKLSHNALFFPSNSAYGVFAAIAVPLDLPHRNVFISYNFEANYNLPETWNLPPYAIGVEEEDLFEDAARFNSGKDCTNCTSSSSSTSVEETVEDVDDNEEITEESDVNTTTAPYRNETESNSRRKRGRKRREIPSLLTRTHFYQILIDKFERSGFEGEPCLLRLICETNASELGEINGVLGNLIHIMFSPTTSKNENLPLAYYQAEIDGVHDQCHHYEEVCTESILDLISTPIHEYIEQMENEIHNLGK